METRLLAVAAAVECLAGLAFVLFPAIPIALLLDTEPGSTALMIGRVSGVALLALGVACTGAARAVAGSARTWTVIAITLFQRRRRLVAGRVCGPRYGSCAPGGGSPPCVTWVSARRSQRARSRMRPLLWSTLSEPPGECDEAVGEDPCCNTRRTQPRRRRRRRPPSH